MKRTLSAHDQPVSRIFSDDYVFTIPGYQRPYSWKTEQAYDLVDDLFGAMGELEEKLDQLSPYFLGSIVLIKEDGSSLALVVDGQQRLTTLTLLLSAIRAKLTKPQARDGISKLIYEQGDVILNTENHYRMTLREKDKTFFRDYVQLEDGFEKLVGLDGRLIDSQSNLRANAKVFDSYLSNKSQDELLRLAQLIATKCYLVVVCTPDLESAFRIFNVLNSRGLDLSATDILKAEITGTINDSKRDHYTAIWEDIEDDLGRDAFNDLFSYIRTIYRKAKSQGTLLKEFRDHVKIEKAECFIDDTLMPMSSAYEEVLDASYTSQENAEAVNESLRWLNRIEFKDWMAPTLAFFVRHRDNASKVRSFVINLERLVYSMLIRKMSINDRIERCARLTASIERNEDLWGKDSPLQLAPGEQHQTYHALAGPIYDTHSARALALILLRLDSLLSGGGATYDYGAVSVEHVLPQNPPSPSEWLEWFPDPAKRIHWTHRLGNLTLLTRRKNSSARNYDFDKKKKSYFTKGGVSPFVLTTQVLRHAVWNEDVVTSRQSELLRMFETHLRLKDRRDPAQVILDQL